MNKASYNIKVQQFVAAISVLLFIVKMIAWLLTGSIAILTDAMESIVNVLAGFIGLSSLYISARPRDMDHPYGHGKAEFISAAIEGTLIFVTGFFIIYKAGMALLQPQPVRQLDWGILLLAAAGLINYIVGTVCVNTGKKNHSLALIASGKHLQTDTYTSVGILAGLAILYFTQIWWIDSVVAIAFALIIIYTGAKIIRSSIAGIMDEADMQLLQNLVQTLNQNRSVNWIDLHNLRIIKYGSTLHLDCHLTVPWYFNVREAHHEIDRLSELVKEKYGPSVELFVHSDACMEYSCAICSKTDCPVRLHPFTGSINWTMENISQNKKHGSA